MYEMDEMAEMAVLLCQVLKYAGSLDKLAGRSNERIISILV